MVTYELGTEGYIEEAMEEYANQSKWISVEERLPKKGQAVLVANSVWGSVFNSLYYQIKGKWYELKENGTNTHITHWHPLPEAPTS